MGNQDQNQKQEIKLQKDGTWEAVYCPFYVDDLTKDVISSRNRWSEGSKGRTDHGEQLRKLREVKTLTYEGKVVKAQCHLYLNNVCNSDLNKNKPCHLL